MTKLLMVAVVFGAFVLASNAYAQVPTGGPCCPAACVDDPADPTDDLPPGVGCAGTADGCVGGDLGATDAHTAAGCVCSGSVCICTGPAPCADTTECTADAKAACCSHLPAGHPDCQ